MNVPVIILGYFGQDGLVESVENILHGREKIERNLKKTKLLVKGSQSLCVPR